MGTLHDQAVAQAETELRRRLDEYRFSGRTDDPTIKDNGGLLVPEWIGYAAAYIQKVVLAFARELLDPAAPDPFERVAKVEQHQFEVSSYLFHKYFYEYALLWNHRSPETQNDDELANPIDEEMFGMLVFTQPTTMKEGVGELVHQAVSEFWEKRSAGDTGESLHDRQEVEAVRTLSTPERSCDPVTQIQPRFPKRGAWLKNRLSERAWNRNDPLRHGGPDPKTIDKIVQGIGVREDVLEKLAKALSKKFGKVDLLTIPRD